MRLLKWGVSISSGLLVVLALWAFCLEPSSLHNAAYRLSVSNWPVACAGFKIALLADLHVGSPFNGLSKLDQIVQLTNAANPDLVVLAGDYVIHGVLGGTFVDPERIAASLARLQARVGVYAVLGNHDWWYDARRIQRAFEQHSISVLENQAVEIKHDACRFWLVGIGDYTEQRHRVDRALVTVPSERSVVAVTHNPDLFPDLPQRVTLTLAGHTHGGQVNLPWLGRLVVPSRYGQRYAIGHIVERRQHLFVTPGLGTSILPVRFRVPPEVTLLQLIPAQEA